MRILAWSGSLRKGSSNTKILHAAAAMAPEGITLELYDGLGDLPHFNPDFDQVNVPDRIRAFRDSVRAADALLISTPEYAHGIPGSLKNSLDWLVSEIGFAGKPVGLILGSATEGGFAQAALVEVLKTMSARVIHEAVINVPGARVRFDDEGRLIDPEAISKLRQFLSALSTVNS